MSLYKKAQELLDGAIAVLEDADSTEEMVAKATADVEQAEALKARAEMLDSAKSTSASFKKAQAPAELPTSGSGNSPASEKPAAPESTEDIVAKAVTIIRSGSLDDPTSIVMREVYNGQDYRELNHRQMKAFNGYLRYGKHDPVLEQQVWGADDVKGMLEQGMSVAEVKATMVEGTDILGGYAVPVDVSSSVIRRLRGLTAVRAAGATVIMTEGKSIEWLKVTGGNSQYAGAVRGAWGSETQSPSETNMTLGSLNIPVNVYTYKMPISVSLLEDATNLTDLFAQEVAEALALDEDIAFLTGDGANKPHGLLPGGLNARGLNSVLTGASGALAINGLKALRRGVASQYRGKNASLVGSSATGLAIEQLVDGNTRHYVEELVAGEYNKTISATWRENEVMPAISAGTVPMIYGDFSGYAIVERLGLSIQRYNDSNTGINVVQFQVRRRLGGDVIAPWKFAVQTVTS